MCNLIFRFKVIRIYACWIYAFVVDLKIFRDIADESVIRKSVGGVHLAIAN